MQSLAKRLTALATAPLLVLMTQASLFAQQQPYYPGPQQPYPYSNQYDPGKQYQQPYASANYGQPQSGYGAPQTQGLGPDQLQQLVAPIALNPDPLVALMLAASTYPQQVSDADHWRQSQGNAPPDQIVYGADQQNWDPSVKSLTAFPQVLAEMDQNLPWTAALGNAYYNQPQDVLQAIQIMRQRAQSAGNLQPTPEENVSYDQGNIQLMPVNPQVVYVPAYNPWTVYGQPVAPYPGFSLLGALGSFFNSSFGSSAVRFGLGTVMSAFSSTPFGLLSWGLDWLTHSLLFHHSDYYSSSPYVADWGLRYGGPRAYLAPHRSFVAYNRGYSGNRYGYNRSNYAYNRANYGSNDRSSLYNRSQSAYASRTGYSYNRTQSYTRPAYNSGSYGRPQSPFANRSYTSGYNAYRAPANNYARDSFNQRSNAYRSNAFMGSSERSARSGGFHPFGSNHNAGSFGHERSFKEPKYKAPKAPKMHSSGHHSFSHSGGHRR